MEEKQTFSKAKKLNIASPMDAFGVTLRQSLFPGVSFLAGLENKGPFLGVLSMETGPGGRQQQQQQPCGSSCRRRKEPEAGAPSRGAAFVAGEALG